MAESLERQKHGGSVVVDHQGVFGPGQPLQQRLHVAIPGATFLSSEVELEIRVGRGDCPEPLEGQGAHERSAQIGVQHDALRVDNGPQGEWTGLSRTLHDARRQGLGRRRRSPLLENTGALLLERLADERGQARPRESAELFLIREPAEELIDRGLDLFPNACDDFLRLVTPCLGCPFPLARLAAAPHGVLDEPGPQLVEVRR